VISWSSRGVTAPGPTCPGACRGELGLVAQHQQQVIAQLAALNACLELITFKVKIYEESLPEGAAVPDNPTYDASASGRHWAALGDLYRSRL
jgi:hypothetical protein